MVKHLPAMRETGFDPWVGKISWRRTWQPTPVFLPGKSHGWRNLVDYGPWGAKESDTTERLHFYFSSKIWFQSVNHVRSWMRDFPSSSVYWLSEPQWVYVTLCMHLNSDQSHFKCPVSHMVCDYSAWEGKIQRHCFVCVCVLGHWPGVNVEKCPSEQENVICNSMDGPRDDHTK